MCYLGAGMVLLHPLWYLYAEQCHAILNHFSHVLSQYEAGNLLCFGICIEDAIVVIELIELLGQFVAIVSNTTWTIVYTSLCNSCTEVVELLNERNLLLVQWCVIGE